MPNSDLFTSRGAYVNLRYIAMLYTHSIGNSIVYQNHYTSRITQMYRGKVAGKMKKDGTEIKDII